MMGDFQRAVETAENAVKTSEKFFGKLSEKTIYAMSVQAAYFEYAAEKSDNKKFLERAIEILENALRIAKYIYKPDDKHMSDLMFNLAYDLSDFQIARYLEAITLCEKTIAIDKKNNSDIHIVIYVTNHMAETLIESKEYQKAKIVLQDLISYCEEKLGEYAWEIPRARKRLAIVLEELGLTEEAESENRKIRDWYKQDFNLKAEFFGENSIEALDAYDKLLIYVGKTFAGNFKKQQILKELLQDTQKRFSREDAEIILWAFKYNLYFEEWQYDLEFKLKQNLFEIFKNSFSFGDEKVIEAMKLFAYCQEDCLESEKILHEQAELFLEKLNKKFNENLATQTINVLEACYEIIPEDKAKDIDIKRKIITVLRKKMEKHSNVLLVKKFMEENENLADYLLEDDEFKNYDEAEKILMENAELSSKYFGENSEENINAVYDLACKLKEIGKTDKAITEFRRIVDILDSSWPKDDYALQRARNDLANTLEEKGDYSAALLVRKKNYNCFWSVDNHQALANAFMKLKDFDAAIEWQKELIIRLQHTKLIDSSWHDFRAEKILWEYLIASGKNFEAEELRKELVQKILNRSEEYLADIKKETGDDVKYFELRPQDPEYDEEKSIRLAKSIRWLLRDLSEFVELNETIRDKAKFYIAELEKWYEFRKVDMDEDFWEKELPLEKYKNTVAFVLPET